MSDEIRSYCEEAYEKMITLRRDIHKHPEAACLEYRTASIVIQTLRDLGYEVHYGPEAMNLKVVKNILPTEAEANGAIRRAISEGGRPKTSRSDEV